LGFRGPKRVSESSVSKFEFRENRKKEELLKSI